jgi:hypothetical protein
VIGVYLISISTWFRGLMARICMAWQVHGHLECRPLLYFILLLCKMGWHC